MTHRGTLLVLAAFAMCAAPAARAQVLYGSITGNVSDASGAPVPGASVKATNSETGQSRQTETNDSGSYTFPSLNAGPYAVTIVKEGFQTFSARRVDVAIDRVARVDARLTVGAVSETVSVSAQAAQLQTDSAEVRNEVTHEVLENVPVPVNRDFESLLIMVPGMGVPENANSSAANPSRTLTFSANGTPRVSRTVRIDGAATNNAWLPYLSGYSPGLDAIETVSVVSGTFDAAQGAAGGAAINVHVKSGTNQIHGSVFGLNMTNWLGSRQFFQPAGQVLPKFINNTFGGTIGGPIKRDKLFYFVSYDGHFLRQNANRTVTVPTAAQRRGDMSAAAQPIYDPLTGSVDGSGRTAFPGNQIPVNRLDPIALKMQDHVPLPNLGNGTSNNYFATGPFSSNRHTNDAKIDWRPKDKLSLSARVGWLKYDLFNAATFGDNGQGISSAGSRPGNIYGNVITTTYNATYILSPSIVLDGFFTTTHQSTNSEPPGFGQNLGKEMLGIPGTNGADSRYTGWPYFNISSYAIVGMSANSSGGPLFYNDNQYQYSANATWTKQRHNVRFGSEVARVGLDHFEAASTFAGQFNFGAGPTQLKGGPATTQFNNYASFLLGMPGSVQKDVLPFGNLVLRWRLYNFYVQDQFHASNRLSLSYGLLWNYFPLGSRDNHGVERYDFTNNTMQVCGFGQTPKDCGYHVSRRAFSPNFGFSYRLTDSLVVRSGFGLSYDPSPLAYNRDMLSVYPEILSFTLNGPNSFAPSSKLSDGIPALNPPTSLGSGVLPLPIGVEGRTLPQSLKRDYVLSWNFTLEKQFSQGFLASAGYVATRGIDIPQYQDQNYQSIGGGAASQPYNQKFGTTAGLILLTPLNHTHYDSLQTQLNKRVGNGSFVRLAYTFSKNTGLCCNDLADTALAITDPRYLNLARSLMPFDRTHHFSAGWGLRAPFGKGQRWLTHGAASAIAGGWMFNGLWTASSGKPFTPSASGTSLNASGNTQRADLVKPEVAILGGVGPGQPYFDTTAYAAVTAARFGTAGYNTLRGPSVWNVDASIARQFQPSERLKIQFRMEGFNVTNTPHFGNPGNTVGNGSFGIISSVLGTGREGNDQRMFRFVLKAMF